MPSAGLLAIVFAAAYFGSDWNWGVLRNVIARGEGRERYLLAKFIALAITLFIGMLICSSRRASCSPTCRA